MVPNTSELLPDPDTPVNTVSRRFGISTLTSFRLFTRAPCTRIRSWLSAVSGVEGAPFAFGIQHAYAGAYRLSIARLDNAKVLAYCSRNAERDRGRQDLPGAGRPEPPGDRRITHGWRSGRETPHGALRHPATSSLPAPRRLERRRFGQRPARRAAR